MEARERLMALPSILVIVPSMWGSFSNWLAMPPPLKSMITKPTSRGLKCTARARIRDWSSSLLPEPVVPATRPWGPWAFSWRSRVICFPPSPIPRGTAMEAVTRLRLQRAPRSSSPAEDTSSISKKV